MDIELRYHRQRAVRDMFIFCCFTGLAYIDQVLKGAFVTYCNEAKIMQGVPAEIIDKYTVYSTQTAEAMAKGFV